LRGDGGNGASEAEAPTGTEVVVNAEGKRLIARDAKNNPLFSSLDWTEDVVQRVMRVPAGFMRNRTQDRIEELANERGVATIDLDVVEAGIEIGRQQMAQMIAGYETNPEAARRSMAEGENGKGGVTTNARDVTRETGDPLNEASFMSAMQSRREKSSDQ
jgi:hypothetical protein